MTAAPSSEHCPPTCLISGSEVNPEGTETELSPQINASSPRRSHCDGNQDLASITLMQDISENVIIRHHRRATPRPIVNLHVESDEAKSLTAQTPRLCWPDWITTTDSAPLLPSWEQNATSLAGTPCGLGNPWEREHKRAWGRLVLSTEEDFSPVTWGRNRLKATSNNALKVWTWGRTTNARFSTWNSAGDVPNRPSD